jgi:acetyl esterase
VVLDPAAAVLCERIRRAGSGVFAGRTPAEVRREGLRLDATWSLDPEALAVMTWCSRNGPATAAEVAAGLGVARADADAQLDRLRRAGFARARETAAGVRWTALRGGRRRRAAAGGGLAALAADPGGAGPAPGASADADVAPGVRVRWYRPEVAGTTPMVLFVHGGAWVSGTIDAYNPVCDSLVEATGFLVASVGYRLAPEDRFPAQLDDVAAALAFVRAEGPALGGDPDRLALMGDSAGGNLAVVTALEANRAAPGTVAALVVLYPVLDATMASPSVVEHADAPLFSRADMEWMYDHYGAPPDDWRGSPLAAPDLAAAPPTLVLTADVDPVRDDGVRFAARLAAAGVPVTHENFPGMMHGFYAFAPALDAATRARAVVAAELRRRLGPAGSSA